MDPPQKKDTQTQKPKQPVNPYPMCYDCGQRHPGTFNCMSDGMYSPNHRSIYD